MLTIVLDANPIHADPWLTSPPGMRLRELARTGACRVVVPEVVRQELHRQQREAARESHAKLVKDGEAMAGIGVDVTQTSDHLAETFRRFDADIDRAFAELLNFEGVASEPVPEVPAADILERDLGRRRPFMEVKRKDKRLSVGFRDTLIWETVLAILDPARGYDKVLFVTADGGFLTDDARSIHPDLLADLDKRDFDRDRLVSIKNVYQANAFIENKAVQVGRVTAATEALYELVGQDVSMQMTNGGDYDYPDFVKFAVPPLEGAYISDIDQTSEFEFSGNGDSVMATAEATVYVEGAVFKGDWYMDEVDSVEVGSELNEHYFEGSSAVDVHVVVEIDVSGDGPEVVRITLGDKAV